ncbi:ketopantoate reductase family protein [Rheinheimera sp. UJ63]|uniref:ketopantoate reductase family protein n=1 Tax=Rheinheimera sp. UJ63 TaxID=2910157 RepID=UPI001F2C4737|nr:ketopantoate reductase family protein [Rheinheimera sp. UJ63]MCF4007969.1 ketopantoate reductase family protein [Rheinheimera sp. UJ63]
MATTQQALNWTVVGQGAIGLLAACRWQQANTPVRLWLRQPKLLSVRFLALDHTEQQCHFQAAVSPIHALFLPVKAYAVTEALAQLQPHLTDNAQIVVSHNGMPDLAALRQFARAKQGIWFLTTSHGALRQAEQIRHTGQGKSMLSPLNEAASAQRKAVFTALNQALGPLTVTENIIAALWQKLAINAAINPLTAVLNCKNGALAAAEHQPQLQQIVSEVCQLASLEQIDLPFAATFAQVQQVITATANNYSSMQQDHYHGRPTELSVITGFIVATAAKHQLAVPANQALWQALQDN